MANFIPSGWRELLEESQAKINAACSSFIQIGFSTELFSINNLRNYGYTEAKFLELIQPISFITGLRSLTFLFNTARQSIIPESPFLTPSNEFCIFVNCINWIKSELSTRMLKKEMSKLDVALARLLVDSAAPLIQKHKSFQSAIDELKNRQMELERESAKTSDELKLKLGPIYGYEEPSLSELINECYLLYEKDCRLRWGRTNIPKLDEMELERENLVPVFGGTVKERHLVKFLNDPVRKEIIETHFNNILFEELAAMAMGGGNGY